MTPDELHHWARPIILDALEVHKLEYEPISVALAVHGVGWLESRYGTAWRAAGVGSNNWGAIQSSRPPCDSATSFQYVDSHPNADGTSTKYSICFRKYRTPEEGASGLVLVELVKRPSVLEAARRGDYYGVSAALHATRYYEGFGSTVAQRIANHYRALSSAIAAAAAANNEEVPTLKPPDPEPWQDDFLPDNPLILRGSRGEYVKTWQRILNIRLDHAALAVDGAFGSLTMIETIVWQRDHGLKADGKVGPKTWQAAADTAG